MALATEFLRLLDRAMDRRTDAMRRLVIRTKGAPKKMNKRVRDSLCVGLLDSASQLLVREKAKKEFQKLATPRQLRFIAGHGIRKRFDNLYSWARKKSARPHNLLVLEGFEVPLRREGKELQTPERLQGPPLPHGRRQLEGLAGQVKEQGAKRRMLGGTSF